MPLEFMRHGSSKEILRADKGIIGFSMTDDFSVFDVGKAPFTIPGKGKAICDCAVKAFEIAESVGVPTHFVERVDDVTILVREVQIITGRNIGLEEENYLVPAEWIARFAVAGSLDRAFKSGKERPEHYGLPAGVIPKTGTPLPYPAHQLTTKLEAIDRKMDDDELCLIGGLTLDDIAEYWRMIDRLDGALALQAHKAGFVILDGKKELLMGPGRQKMIGDVFLTPDEDRPAKIVDGKVEHYSKELLRQIYIKLGYKEQLDKARAASLPDPPIPVLGEDLIDLVARRYQEFAKAFVAA